MDYRISVGLDVCDRTVSAVAFASDARKDSSGRPPPVLLDSDVKRHPLHGTVKILAHFPTAP